MSVKSAACKKATSTVDKGAFARGEFFSLPYRLAGTELKRRTVTDAGRKIDAALGEREERERKSSRDRGRKYGPFARNP